jgi:hypothetical protein
MEDEGILFSFSGMISQHFTEFLMDKVRVQLAEELNDRNSVKSIFVISIELLQNIMSYSKDIHIKKGNRHSSPGILLVGFDNNREKYYINTCNEIELCDREKLSSKIDYINSLDKKEQKALLRQKLRSAEDTHDRGAGVGLIEVAKISTEKIEYAFENSNKNLFFHIKAYV